MLLKMVYPKPQKVNQVKYILIYSLNPSSDFP